MRLELKPRSHNPNGIPTWYDHAAVLHALEFITHGKPFIKCGVWIDIARRIDTGNDARGGDITAPVVIELDDVSARKLVMQLQQLPPEAFVRSLVTGQPSPAPLVPLYEMMQDLSNQTGVEIVMEA